MFWTVHPIDWLSLPRLVVFFSGALKCCHWAFFFFFFFLSWSVCYLKGQSLWCFLGRGPLAVRLYVGEGLKGSNGACSTLHRISATPSTTHNQIGLLWCGFPSGWACAHSRPLWISPTTSPVRLGVSPATAPTPTGVFNQRFEALFPHTGALGYMVCFAPCCSSWLISVRMWGHRVCWLSDCLPCSSHTPSVSVPPRPRESSLPWCPSPPLLPVWMYVSFLSPWCGLPCCSIFCQFWLFEEGQCVYLLYHLGSPILTYFYQSRFNL